MKNFTMQVWRGRLALIWLMLLLAGCSLVRLGYSHGESLSYWWLDSYVDFTSEQQPWVRQRIDRLFAWHRKTQLQDYSRLLTRTQDDLSRKVSPAQALAFYDELKKRAWVIVEQALPDLADLALSLTPQQIAHLEKKFASNNEEFRKDRLHRDVDHRQQFRYKKTMQQAEYWFGNFSREQEAAIRQASDARPLNNEIWMEERVRRQQALIALLKNIQVQHPSRDAAIAMLRAYAQDLFTPDPHNPHQEFIEGSREASAQLAAVIINLATPAQKAHAAERMQKWIDNFQALAGRP